MARKLQQKGPEPGNSPALRRRGPFQKLKVSMATMVQIAIHLRQWHQLPNGVNGVNSDGDALVPTMGMASTTSMATMVPNFITMQRLLWHHCHQWRQWCQYCQWRKWRLRLPWAPLTESPLVPMEHPLAPPSGAIETIVAIGTIGGISAIAAVVMKFGTIVAIDVIGAIFAISAIGTNGSPSSLFAPLSPLAPLSNRCLCRK